MATEEPPGNSHKTHRLFLVLLIFAGLLRLVLLAFVHPIVEPDSYSYIDLAERLISLNFADFNAIRTPGYPLIIIMGFFNLKIVVFYQIVMGLMIIFLMLKINNEMNVPLSLNFLAAAIYAFFIQFVAFEFFIMSETLTTFLITLAFYHFIYLLHNPPCRTLKNLLIIFSLTALAAFTRPIYLMLPGYLLLCSLIFLPGEWQGTVGKKALHSLMLLTPTLVLAGGWSLMNYSFDRGFIVATGRGFGLIELMGDHIEQANDDKYAKIIKEAYLAGKERNIRTGAPYDDTIWEVLEILKQETGLTYKQLSDITWSMGVELIKKEPLEYVKKVCRSWFKFWLPPGQTMRHQYEVYFDKLGPLTGAVMVGVIKTAVNLQRKFIGFLEILFLCAPLALLARPVRRNLEKNLVAVFFSVFFFILGKSMAIALIEGGEGRFALPVFPLLICVTLAFYARVWQTVVHHRALHKQPL